MTGTAADRARSTARETFSMVHCASQACFITPTCTSTTTITGLLPSRTVAIVFSSDETRSWVSDEAGSDVASCGLTFDLNGPP
jgi:hypothetical protein